LQRLDQNRSARTAKGAVRQGAALLTGLIVCGTCGRRLSTKYRHHAGPYYDCPWYLTEGTAQACYGVKAHVVDELVAQQVLLALEPAALEVSLNAQRHIEGERQRLDQHWKRRLERGRYEAERIERQYQAVEPENRLVARTLERRWEEALAKLRQLEDEYDRFVRDKPPLLNTTERARIVALSQDLPGLWNAPETTPADRKEVVRCLVERVVVQVRKESEYVGVTIHWQGGFTSEHEVIRPVRLYEQLQGYEQLRDRIISLRRDGCTAEKIARTLNEEGIRTPKMRGDFHPVLIRKLLARWGLANEKAYAGQLNRHEWWLPDLAKEIPVSEAKLADWARRDWVCARRTPAQRLWVLWADQQEIKRLRALLAESRRGTNGYPSRLTTPKRRSV
jgi:hypothetical protein